MARKIYCIFGLYCHCNMEPYTHLEVLEACGIRREDVGGFEFRGGTWPGGFRVEGKDGGKKRLHKTMYTTVLNVLFKLYGADRCYLCIDALSEFADVSFGDFWAGDYTGELAGHERCTLVSQRTPRGLEILLNAQKHGAISMYSLPPERRSRRIAKMALGKKKGNLAWMAEKVRLGLPVPDYSFPLPPLSGSGRRAVLSRRLFFLLRRPGLRRLIVRILFSPAGMAFERCNNVKKRLFGRYHGN
ncbi:MAG: Coenzyme F420 hydrogenase/dehydrogenase, beta subunit C-terminal domain [Desulfococcus multivorans]|nr:Coenzyme F420 hydrogenase/dehydrogenase, beta subunit C-terminal domain [Desulfococcus multivorans]